MSNINLALKPKVSLKTKPEVVKPKAKVKAMDPKDYKGTCNGWKRFNLYKNSMKIRDFLKAGGKTIDLDWDRERGFVAVEIIDEVGKAGKSEKSTFNLKK